MKKIIVKVLIFLFICFVIGFATQYFNDAYYPISVTNHYAVHQLDNTNESFTDLKASEMFKHRQVVSWITDITLILIGIVMFAGDIKRGVQRLETCV